MGALRRSGSLPRYTPLKPGKALVRYARLKQVSPRQRARQRTWADVKRAVFAACGGRCQIQVPGICTGWAHDAHHVRGRGWATDPGPDECLLACRPCHQFVELNRAWAYARGFLVRRNGGAA